MDADKNADTDGRAGVETGHGGGNRNNSAQSMRNKTGSVQSDPVSGDRTDAPDGGDSETLREDIRQLQETVATLAADIRSVVSGRMSSAYDDVREAARKEPMRYIGFAFVAGWLVARLMGSSRP